VLLTYYSVKL